MAIEKQRYTYHVTSGDGRSAWHRVRSRECAQGVSALGALLIETALPHLVYGRRYRPTSIPARRRAAGLHLQP
eukprot:440245-Prymnesium_polylepis.1